MTFSIEALGFERNQQRVFPEVDFVLRAGEFLQVRGANGSGKSTLLRLLAGYLEPAAGKILWNGKCIFQEREMYQAQMNYIGHKNGVKPNLTVLENVTLNAALMQQKTTQGMKETAIKKMGLDKVMHTAAINLSAGQLRRLALTRLLLNPGLLWILDEPTTALDSDGQALLMEMVNQHCHQGGSVIVATHHDLQKQYSATTTKELWLGERNA